MKHLADHGSRPIDLVDGDGCWLFGGDGTKYLDFIAGWCVGNVGWKRKEIARAIQAEAERGRYVSPLFRFAPQEEFASLLVELAPGKRLTRVFRCTSGSEAVEFAIKCARLAAGKKTIVSVDGVYHGHTYGAASVGDACIERMGPCLPGFRKLPMPRTDAEAKAALAAFRGLVETQKDVAAFLSEPVWSNAGAIVPPKAFYHEMQKICRESGVLLIMDEVATGFGRTGRLFASEWWGLEPDILCLGKGLTGGYATMGATLVSEPVYEASRGMPSFSTFGWLPQDLAAAEANVRLLVKEKLWDNAEKIGAYLLRKLKPLEAHPRVGEVRGLGLLLGIEIVRDKSSRLPDYLEAARLQDACAAKGLLVDTAGSAIFITPPLILGRELADAGARILMEVFEA